MTITATRYHDFSAGHVVLGHEGKCAHLHGHNYRVHFTVQGFGPPLDKVGRVVDFSVIKSKLCDWLENHWDHHFLIAANHPWMERLFAMDPEGVVPVQFNPTAENMSHYLLHRIAPVQLLHTGVKLVRVVIEETRKCSAEVSFYDA